MTKKQIIEIIQTTEAESYETFKKFEGLLGEGNVVTLRYRTKWSALYDLCEKLEIPAR